MKLPLLLPLPLLLLLLTTTTTATNECTANHDIHNSTATASAGITDFGFKLMRELVGQENLLISPYSIWSVLAMVLVGAETRTKTELVRVLGLEGKTGALSLWRKLDQSLLSATASDTNVSLNLANRIYINQDFSIRNCQPELSNLLVPLDFSQATQASDTMNNFVNTTTRGLISKIVTPDSLSPSTRMVVVNAVYFKGAWRYPFLKEVTSKQPFFVSPDETVLVDMMYRVYTNVKIGDSTHVKARVLQLPYSTGLFSMTILLPHEQGEAGIKATLNVLSSTSLGHAFKSLRQANMDVQMPKFEINSSFDSKSLIGALQTLGLTDLFTASADLTSFADNLYVEQMMHKTVVKVNEEGSVAAASTVELIIPTSLRKVIRVNRPFLFLIHSDDTILFVGAYLKP